MTPDGLIIGIIISVVMAFIVTMLVLNASTKKFISTNAKLVDRGTRMIQESLGIGYDEAQERLLERGSVDKALNQD